MCLQYFSKYALSILLLNQNCFDLSNSCNVAVFFLYMYCSIMINLNVSDESFTS